MSKKTLPKPIQTMDAPKQESLKKKTTSIPRLNKKISCESPFTYEFQEDNSFLNRCSSDPNQHSFRTEDLCMSNIPMKTKKLCKFTLNEKLKNGRNEEMNISDNNEVDDDMNGEDHNKHINHEARKDSYEKHIHVGVVNERNNEKVIGLPSDDNIEALNDSNTHVDNDSHQIRASTCPEIGMSSYQPSIPPLQLQCIQNKINEDAILRNQSPRQSLSLQEAYLKQVGNENHQQQFEQCKWNIINPLYKNISMRRNLPKNMILNPSLVSDMDVKKLTHKEESSDIESDDETVFKTAKSCNNDKSNSGLSRLYNSLTNNKENTSLVNKNSNGNGESLVNAFMEVFGNDSHIIQKLQKNRPIKNDGRFRKYTSSNCCKNNSETKEVCVIQESPRDAFNYASRKLKLVQDLYKNDDMYSTVTASSNDKSLPEHYSCQCSPRQPSMHSKSASSNMIKGCGCEIKHLQLNVVQKSIEDIHSTMKIMLDNISPTASEDIAVELMKLRSSYDECLIYQRKITMQNKKLQSEIRELCLTMFKTLETKNSSSKLKYFLLPILGAVVYFVVNHFDFCNKIPVSCDE